MRLRTAGGAVVLAITLSALAHAQQVAIRADDGRWMTASRPLNPADVPAQSALYGITVVESPEGRGVIVSALGGSSPIFYRLAAKCLDACLVRLRGIESTRFGGGQMISGPRVFGYLPVGTGAGFGVEMDEANESVAAYVDLRTGERFGPPASLAFNR